MEEVKPVLFKIYQFGVLEASKLIAFFLPFLHYQDTNGKDKIDNFSIEFSSSSNELSVDSSMQKFKLVVLDLSFGKLRSVDIHRIIGISGPRSKTFLIFP